VEAVDRFESSVKGYGETKPTWSRKSTAKEGELEALKVNASHFFGRAIDTIHIHQLIKATNTELTSQLAISKRPAHGDSKETQTLLSRAVNAEKRLVVV